MLCSNLLTNLSPMLELVEFPYLPGGDPKQAVSALIRVCRELPSQGEQFRFFRRRMKSFRLWDDVLIAGTLAFLGMKKSGTMRPSPLARQIGALKSENKARTLIAERLWEANPLLFKSILEHLNERVYSRDEVVKFIDSFAYRGKKPTRSQLEAWLHLALGLGLLKMVGIALDLDERGRGFLERAAEFDIEEFLEDMAEEQAGRDEEVVAVDAELGPDDSDGGAVVADSHIPAGAAEGQASPAVAQSSPPAAGASVVQGAVGSAGPGADQQVGAAQSSASATADSDVFDIGLLSSPRGRAYPVAVTQFAGHEQFPDQVLTETADRIDTWWREQELAPQGLRGADFGFEAEAWMENAEELLFRIATAAALVFRLGRAASEVKVAYEALDGSGVLRDLYYGTAPDTLPSALDAQALMLASLLARRFAEVPELAVTLEKQVSAADAFAVLDQALGRGLLRIELFWMMEALADLGCLRFEDLPAYTALPRRQVRDALYRLGFIRTPYAHDAVSLVPAAGAARRATGGAAVPPDEVLTAFAQSAGCRYDCPHRRQCEYACRERAE